MQLDIEVRPPASVAILLAGHVGWMGVVAEWGWNFTHSAKACWMGMNGAEWIGRGYYSAPSAPFLPIQPHSPFLYPDRTAECNSLAVEILGVPLNGDEWGWMGGWMRLNGWSEDIIQPHSSPFSRPRLNEWNFSPILPHSATTPIHPTCPVLGPASNNCSTLACRNNHIQAVLLYLKQCCSCWVVSARVLLLLLLCAKHMYMWN